MTYSLLLFSLDRGIQAVFYRERMRMSSEIPMMMLLDSSQEKKCFDFVIFAYVTVVDGCKSTKC